MKKWFKSLFKKESFVTHEFGLPKEYIEEIKNLHVYDKLKRKELIDKAKEYNDFELNMLLMDVDINDKKDLYTISTFIRNKYKVK